MCMILIRFLYSKTPGRERPLEWRTEVTRTKILGVTIWLRAMCPAWQAKHCVLHCRTMKILASPVIPAADSG